MGNLLEKKSERHDIAASLDRFLIFDEWDERFRNIKQSILERVTSDHSPLSLQCSNWEPSKSYFKFENWWLQTEGFKERVKEWRDSLNSVGRPDYILSYKLKSLKAKPRDWSKTLQGNLEMLKFDTLNQLLELEKIQDLRISTEEEIRNKIALTMDFEEIAKKEEMAWRQDQEHYG